ncbi:hypothetical protein CHARACLAT_033119 [Characodon lateralis]|uniref:Rhodanese domain-containing protein n=1 Tax=Characodon lateralis TaxID=208331 RepID=A0ABU7D2Q2_9TELE|nr:hypothetical protein [Characodon lateralis]
MIRIDSQDEFRVILKLKECSFHSMNPLRLAGRLKDELERIKDAQILNDGKLLIFCTSASQAATAAGLKVLEERSFKAMLREKPAAVKGVVYGVSVEVTMEELIK